MPLANRASFFDKDYAIEWYRSFQWACVNRVPFAEGEYGMSELIIGVSGVRGILGDSLDSRVVERLAGAYGALLGKAGRVVLARDSRPSGAEFARTVGKALVGMGFEVIELGIVSTPGAALMVVEEKAEGAVVITASHNPSQWNGLKFLGSDGLGLSAEDMAKLKGMFLDECFRPCSAGKQGKITQNHSTHQTHTARVLGQIDVEAVRGRKFRVVLDSVNGAGGPGGKLLLGELGCELIHINGEPDGQFTHGPEPIAENLGGLCEAVKEHKADIGFAQDPDADRLAIVDELGCFVGEEYSLALAVMNVLGKKAGPVATNLSTSRMVDDLAAKFGVQVYRTPVGETHVARAMAEHNCVIGGEGNGGVIDPAVVMVRDSFSGMSLVLELMAKTKRSVGELIGDIPSYQMLKTKFACPHDRAVKILQAVGETFADQRLDCSDGLRIDWPRGWVHVRSSNTEPVMRIFAEAEDKATVEELIGRITSIAEKN